MGKIIMNGNAYGSVGSDVEANPQGTATDTLNTIGIDNVIYEIQGGGGGSSGVYIEETLWEGSSSSSAWVSPITLNIDVDNYDFIIIKISISEHIISVKEIPIGTSNHISVGGFVSDDGEYERRIWINRDTNVLRIYTSTGTEIIVTKVVGIKTSGDYFSPVIYSTEEREIGVWTDGKPLYQKTIMVDSITHTGEIDVSSLNIDTVVKMNGIANYPDNQWVNFPFYHNDNYYIRVYYIIDGGGDISDNCIYFEVGNNARGVYTNGFLTLQYTKTTDVPGSGQYNTLGVPTVHYSTDEQVIGIDYDGKPLYQKTYTNLGTINSFTNIDLQLSNISWITVDSANSSLSSGFPFPYIHPNANNIIGYFMDMNSGSPIINCRAGGDASGSFTLDKLTVRYKKTTD